MTAQDVGIYAVKTAIVSVAGLLGGILFGPWGMFAFGLLASIALSGGTNLHNFHDCPSM